ncbi:MAG: hypothetical protein AAFO04_26805 [Cyanobacteria bacterium J06592_8]
MTKSRSSASQTIYGKVWNFFRQFPQKLSQGSSQTPEVSGPAAAAIISAAFSCFLLMVNQHLTSIFKAWNQIIWDLGSWIPGSKNPDPLYGEIGSYSGKETVMLIGWLVSWLILHQLWKNKPIKTQTIFFYLFIFMAAATVMNWHPLFPYLPLMPK